MVVPLGAPPAQNWQDNQPRFWHAGANPLLIMPELTWSGKKLAQTAPASLIKDSIIYPNGCGYPSTDYESRLIQGDNLSVMAALLPHYEGHIALIYADPPFFT